MRPLNLLCVLRLGTGVHRGRVQLPVALTGQVALQAPADLFGGRVLGGAAGGVFACPWVNPQSGHDGHVEGLVESTVAASVHPVADCVS